MTQLDNPILLTDSYKLSHYRQYPPGTSFVRSYFESRGGKYDRTVFFGLQYILKRYLTGPVVTPERIAYADRLASRHFGKEGRFNREGWEYILKNHGGRIPLEIRAVPEGQIVPGLNVLMTAVNTDPHLSWLTNYFESLLVQVWYPTTVASQSRYMKELLHQRLVQTGNPDGILFKLHDFGFRGSSSVESSQIGGAAHLVNFLGTDTVPALALLDEYYGEECGGFSIPASEHSTITSWLRENEVKAMENMLRIYPDGLVACVSDSFDIYRACGEYWGGVLKDQVLQRDGILVVRPDSGDPTVVLPKILEILGEKFGYTVNTKGYKVLHPKVRLIQGDGIEAATLDRIMSSIIDAGWSIDNIAFGSGGGLLQKVNRDTLKFAFKCSEIVVNDERRNVFKDPVTDPGKRSKQGRLKLVRGPAGLITVAEDDPGEDLLVTVFRNGELLVDHNLADIRRRATEDTVLAL